MSTSGPGFFAIGPDSPPSEFVQVDVEACAQVSLLIQVDSECPVAGPGEADGEKGDGGMMLRRVSR